MTRMNEAYREQFLAETRYGYLTTLTSEGQPRTVPVWFAWNGEVVKLFTGIGSPKVARIRQNPWISLLVANHMDEKEAWVAFDGEATIETDGTFGLVEALAAKYWDSNDPERAAVFQSWAAAKDQFCTIVLRPDKIRNYYD